jgi:hypothetical protein
VTSDADRQMKELVVRMDHMEKTYDEKFKFLLEQNGILHHRTNYLEAKLKKVSEVTKNIFV